MKTLLFTTLFIFITSYSFSQWLNVNDPQTWRSGNGTIEETAFTYQPEGIFMKVDWEITFSAKGLEDFSEKDTLEVVYNFVLPQEAFVIDSWLWFGDTILKAMIIDRWSANQVYENIVNRRRDPSVLYKNGNGYYELRIYPMAAKESRKVKITYLTPAAWNNKTVSSSFPADNLMVSKFPIENIGIYANLTEQWKNPVIEGTESLALNPGADNESGGTHYLKLHFKQLDKGQKFQVSSPMRNGVYLSCFENQEGGFYQLALNPSEGMDLRTPRKVLFLVDYQKENSGLTQQQLLSSFSDVMRELMNEKDSFNILYYDLELQMASKNWIPGDSASIVQLVEGMGENPFVSYSNLPSLLASGIDVAQEESGIKMVLLANSDRLSDSETANRLIEDLMKRMDPVIPVFIGDFQDRNYFYRMAGNYRYYGNEYFYRNLAKLTGGDYTNTTENTDFSQLLQNIYSLATNGQGLFDVYSTLENGFCYGRYTLSSQNVINLNNIFLQTGRYTGDFPFRIEMAGMNNDEIFSRTLSLEKENVSESDSLTATYWYGRELYGMENSANNYSMVNDIIEKSIDHRILTGYTAFLCLEPGMMSELEKVDDKPVYMRGAWNSDGAVTSAEEIYAEKTEIEVYPNPFSDFVNIEIQLPEGTDARDIQLEIYDLFGTRIKVFAAEEFTGNREIKIRWNIEDSSGNSLPKGTYLFVCTTGKGRISKKLILM